LGSEWPAISISFWIIPPDAVITAAAIVGSNIANPPSLNYAWTKVRKEQIGEAQPSTIPAQAAAGCKPNFCRIHQTLRVTPAMEAGISDHVWSLEEIVRLLH
jgi:hypothetical protein